MYVQISIFRIQYHGCAGWVIEFNYSANLSAIAAFLIACHAARKMANVMHHAEEKEILLDGDGQLM